MLRLSTLGYATKRSMPWRGPSMHFGVFLWLLCSSIGDTNEDQGGLSSMAFSASQFI